MGLIDKCFLATAYIFKYLNFPHFIKYLLYILIKRRNIRIYSHLAISNAKIKLNLRNFIEYWMFVDGLYERQWVEITEKLVKGKVLIDVGANIGTYSLALYKSARKLYAIEPEEKNYRQLLNNLKQNSVANVLTIKKALSSVNKSGTKLFINKDDPGWHSLTIDYAGKVQKIDAITLDQFIKIDKIKNIGLIKIDVEGAESEVLKGSAQTLRKQIPFLVEFNLIFSSKSGYNLIDILNLFHKNKFKAYILRNGKLTLLTKSGLTNVRNENVLFLPRNKKPI